MRNTSSPPVVGVFTDPGQARQAVAELKRMGFRDDQIGVVGRDGTSTGTVAAADRTGQSKAAEGAAAGAATGAGVGALWALGIAAGMLPAIGPVIAGGILASVLASAAGGAAIAGIVGALIGLGLSEEEAHYYEGEVKSGRTLVTVQADGRAEEVRSILRRYHGYDMRNTTSAQASATGSATTTNTNTRGEGGQTVRVHEEHLRATKTPVEAGEVRVRKEVITEQQNMQVPVTREEVVIERRPAQGRASAADIKPGEEVRIPVKEEQVKIEKEAVVTGEVTVGKRKVTETKDVSGSVRKEEIKVEQTGDAKVRDKGTRPDRK